MDKDTLTIPTVHLNGTSRDELTTQLETAGHALRAACDALALAAPNGRDYYPQGSAALTAALREHAERVRRVREVYDEILAIYERVLE